MKARIVTEREGELRAETFYFDPGLVEAFYVFTHDNDPMITLMISGMDYTLEYEQDLYDRLVKEVLDD